MRWDWGARGGRLSRGGGVKEQKDRFATAEKDIAARLAGDQVQAKDPGIEGFGRPQVRTIEADLEKGLWEERRVEHGGSRA
jgi:hypothetical protein